MERQPRFPRFNIGGGTGYIYPRNGCKILISHRYLARNGQNVPNIKRRGQKPPQEHRKRAQDTGRQEQTGRAAGAALCALYLYNGKKAAGLYNIIKST